MAGRPWTFEERALAVECESIADFARVARMINRTPAAVANKRYLLRPKGDRYWTPAEDAILATLPADRKCRKGEITAIADLLPGRTLKAINYRRRYLRRERSFAMLSHSIPLGATPERTL